jgi:hypothetical protein
MDMVVIMASPVVVVAVVLVDEVVGVVVVADEACCGEDIVDIVADVDYFDSYPYYLMNETAAAAAVDYFDLDVLEENYSMEIVGQ